VDQGQNEADKVKEKTLPALAQLSSPDSKAFQRHPGPKDKLHENPKLAKTRRLNGDHGSHQHQDRDRSSHQDLKTSQMLSGQERTREKARIENIRRKTPWKVRSQQLKKTNESKEERN